MSEIPEDIKAAARAICDEFEPSEHAVAVAIARERERLEALANRRTTDLKYMLQAYRNMLGPKGLEVAEMWEKSGVLRVHFDWTGAAASLTGEQRAEEILAWERAPKRLVENIDGDLPTRRFTAATIRNQP